MNLQQWFEQVYPLLLNKVVDKIERTLADGTVIKAYWAGTIIRVDIKP